MPFVNIANNLFDKEDSKPSNKETNTNKEGKKDTEKNGR